MERPKGYTALIEAKGYKSDSNWPSGTRKWGVTIVNTKSGKSASFQYYTGPAIRETPTMRDVAQALITDGSFYEDNTDKVEFALNCGYEYVPNRPDSWQDPEFVKAYNACQRHATAMHRVFGEDLEAMREWCYDN